MKESGLGYAFRPGSVTSVTSVRSLEDPHERRAYAGHMGRVYPRGSTSSFTEPEPDLDFRLGDEFLDSATVPEHLPTAPAASVEAPRSKARSTCSRAGSG
jgi:hypothetical protein